MKDRIETSQHSNFQIPEGTLMRDVFRGWRRKVGCVLLLLACAVLVAWLRSYLVDNDTITFATNPHRQIYSHDGSVAWNISYPDDTWGHDFFWPMRAPARDIEPNALPQFNWRWEVCGFVGSEISLYGYRVVQYWVPYWSIATPLALLAALLILWKPRSRPEPKHAEAN